MMTVLPVVFYYPYQERVWQPTSDPEAKSKIKFTDDRIVSKKKFGCRTVCVHMPQEGGNHIMRTVIKYVAVLNALRKFSRQMFKIITKSILFDVCVHCCQLTPLGTTS